MVDSNIDYFQNYQYTFLHTFRLCGKANFTFNEIYLINNVPNHIKKCFKCKK